MCDGRKLQQRIGSDHSVAVVAHCKSAILFKLLSNKTLAKTTSVRVGSSPIAAVIRSVDTPGAERGRCLHVVVSRSGRMVPVLPRTRERRRKATRVPTRCNLPHPSGLNRRGTFRFFDRALARKSRANRFSRHRRLDPSSTAQRASGSSKRSRRFSHQGVRVLETRACLSRRGRFKYSDSLDLLGLRLRGGRHLTEERDHVGALRRHRVMLPQERGHLAAMVRRVVHHVHHHLPER